MRRPSHESCDLLLGRLLFLPQIFRVGMHCLLGKLKNNFKLFIQLGQF